MRIGVRSGCSARGRRRRRRTGCSSRSTSSCSVGSARRGLRRGRGCGTRARARRRSRWTSTRRLLTAHSEKELAAGNYKHGYGFHPLGCWLDETGEALAAILRPGNAGLEHRRGSLHGARARARAAAGRGSRSRDPGQGGYRRRHARVHAPTAVRRTSASRSATSSMRRSAKRSSSSQRPRGCRRSTPAAPSGTAPGSPS